MLAARNYSRVCVEPAHLNRGLVDMDRAQLGVDDRALVGDCSEAGGGIGQAPRLVR